MPSTRSLCRCSMSPRLVTGLYEDVHGLISNHMFDPTTNMTFEPSANMSNADWWPYPAIWTINEQRKGARSGVVGWPQDAIRVSRYQPYERTRPFREIIDQVLRWFDDPIAPVNFGAIYFLEPDLTGRLEHNPIVLSNSVHFQAIGQARTRTTCARRCASAMHISAISWTESRRVTSCAIVSISSSRLITAWSKSTEPLGQSTSKTTWT